MEFGLCRVAIVNLLEIHGKIKFTRDKKLLEIIRKDVQNINAYLVAAPNIEITSRSKPAEPLTPMQFGNHPYYGSALIFSQDEAREMISEEPGAGQFIRPFYGSKEFITASPRACLWIEEEKLSTAMNFTSIAQRVMQGGESYQFSRT